MTRVSWCEYFHPLPEYLNNFPNSELNLIFRTLNSIFEFFCVPKALIFNNKMSIFVILTKT